MKSNPYAWQGDQPRRVVTPKSLSSVVDHVRRGTAVKIVGGRGMGKSVLLRQVADRFVDPATRVAFLPGPAGTPTVAGAVTDVAAKWGITDLRAPRLEELLERVIQGDVTSAVVLIDEADQYISLGAEHGLFARQWFNKLEATRKDWGGAFGVAFAGGLGLLYLEHELGSGIVSRAESCVLEPFELDEVRRLAAPFEEDGRPLSERCLETLIALSGGNPALVTFGLERLWPSSAPDAVLLERAFGEFTERHTPFVRAVHRSISDQGRLDAPHRVLEAVRAGTGLMPLAGLRAACAPRDDRVAIDHRQALELLVAAGLVRVAGLMSADPVAVSPIASILNFAVTPSAAADPLHRLMDDVCLVLANLHRFGRDFHGKGGLLEEQVFSSMIAVGLRLLGWVEVEREPIQVAGFTDVKVRVTQPSVQGHVVIEVKLWRSQQHNGAVQRQIDDYRLQETIHGVAITLGNRNAQGWVEDYEDWCLRGLSFERKEAPVDLVGRWHVRGVAANGPVLTDHLLVRIPKRD